MLVLSRHIGERIRIGDEIEIVVLLASNRRVRLGITAPIEVPVHREELAIRLAGGTYPTDQLQPIAVAAAEGRNACTPAARRLGTADTPPLPTAPLVIE